MMGLWATFKTVYCTRIITEEQYFVVSLSASIVYFIALTTTFALSMYVCGINVSENTQPLFNPSGQWYFNTVASFLHLGILVFTAILILVLISLCLWKREYSLIKARGLSFIVGLGVSSFLAIVGVSMGVVKDHWYDLESASKWYQYIRLLLVTVGAASILSLIATRQAFLYFIFVRYPYSQRSHRRNLSIVYLLCITPAIVYAILLAENINNNFGMYSRLVSLVPFIPPIFVLVCFAWKSRNISTGFGYWESYARLGIAILLSSLISGVTLLLWPSTSTGKQPIWFVLIIEYERMWVIAITMCELLLTLSILALLNVQPQDKLHPKNTQNITFKDALKSVKDASPDQFAEMVAADRIEIITVRNDAEPDKKLQSPDRLSPANISMCSPLSGEHADGNMSCTYDGSLGNALNENIISL